MSAFKVLVPDAHLRDLDVERAVSGDRLDYQVFDETDASAIPDATWRECDAVLVWHRMKITPEVIAKLDRCRMIVRVGVGYDNVDGDACRSRGIPLCNVPNYERPKWPTTPSVCFSISCAASALMRSA
ncbi:lactate dehydrogenase-like 2-hydroxyacid dehydrogenase [Rhodoligotrophos appendicifer]|uniref:hypothetical protein n=1 Tax=Rhodoligotrophos appendicifer TaxID=987056 RepID=UPI00195FB913|nr:hypothetical protein [Rhodoligotrophos appendicifer]